MEPCLQLKRSQPQVGSNPEPLDQKASSSLVCLFTVVLDPLYVVQ